MGAGIPRPGDLTPWAAPCPGIEQIAPGSIIPRRTPASSPQCNRLTALGTQLAGATGRNRSTGGRPMSRILLAALALVLFMSWQATPALAAGLDRGDTAWMLTSTALVLMMTIPGLAMFYAGMVRKMNVLAT